MLEERKLQKVKIDLLRNPQFALMSGILMVGKTSIKDDIPTAATNGRDEYYGRKFVADMSTKELGFVVMHESMHKMYRHLTTWSRLNDIDRNLANCACDYVINLQLRDLDPTESYITMPRYKSGEKKGDIMGLIDEKYRGMNAKQVFDLLREEQEKRGSEDGEGGEGSEDGEASGGFDEHDWDGAKELSADEQKQLEKDVDQALRQGLMAEKRVGKGAGSMNRDVGNLLAPKVDWREVLREFVKSICAGRDVSTWRKPNRRYIAQDIYMPTLVSERVGHIVVGIDTSGSVSAAEISEFLSEVKAIAEDVKPEMVDLLYWGHVVAAHEKYEENDVPNIVSSTKPTGGGGTSPSCVTDYMAKEGIRPECVIMLTDGYVGNDWGGDWSAPVLWAITGGNDAISTTGKTVHVQST
jgi:predicted metal-dependent peptidase